MEKLEATTKIQISELGYNTTEVNNRKVAVKPQKGRHIQSNRSCMDYGQKDLYLYMNNGEKQES